MRYFKPLILKPNYWDDIEKEIQIIFDQIFYIPIAKILKQNPVFKNANSTAIIDALESGKIYYADGAFYGNFNAKISKEFKEMGGRFNRLHKGWYVDFLPTEILSAINQSDINYQKTINEIVKHLDTVDLNALVKQPDLFAVYDKTIGKMDVAFKDIAKAVSIVPEISEKNKTIIAEEWSQNLELYIKKWSEENILELRQKVQANTLVTGARSEKLVKDIVDNYGVSTRKAKFLARQETSLLMAKFQETRFRDLGSETYKWSGANDSRERPDHVALNGTIQRWDSPPIVDRKANRRANPGEDFGCRCLAVGIIP